MGRGAAEGGALSQSVSDPTDLSFAYTGHEPRLASLMACLRADRYFTFFSASFVEALSIPTNWFSMVTVRTSSSIE